MTVKKPVRTRTIAFRVSEEQYQQLENKAQVDGETANDWCRKLALAEANKEFGMTRNERIFLEELSRIRYLLGHGFRLLANDKLTAEEWEKMRTTAEQKPAEIAGVVLTQYRPARAS